MKEWRSWFLMGLLSVLFGAVVLASPYVASLAITTVTGVLMIVAGGFQIVGGFSVEGLGTRLLTWLMGLILVILGWSFLSNPLAGVLTLATVVLILLAAGGIVRIVLAFRMRRTRFFWPTLLAGAVSLLLALYVWANPGLALAILGVLLGVELVVNGVGLIFMGLFLRSIEKR